MSAGNQSNKIGEILNQILSKFQKPLQSQSLESLSPVRKRCLKLSERLILRTEKYTKESTLKNVFMPFVKKHINNLIAFVMTEKELKDILWESYDDIDELKKELDMALDLKKSITDEVVNKKVMNLPRFKELGNLI